MKGKVIVRHHNNSMVTEFTTDDEISYLVTCGVLTPSQMMQLTLGKTVVITYKTASEYVVTMEGKGAVPPPLGLTPKWIRWEHRKREIEHAIIRYVGCKTPVPLEWVVELNEICEYLNKRENG